MDNEALSFRFPPEERLQMYVKMVDRVPGGWTAERLALRKKLSHFL